MKPYIIVHMSTSIDGRTQLSRWRPQRDNASPMATLSNSRPTMHRALKPIVSNQGAPWSAVCALSLCVFVLIASEFLPVSLLTPIAADLAITEGQAGRAISVSGIFAVATSLLIARVTRGIDRKLILLGMTGLMLLSGLIVALAPSYTVLMM
jgi:hypothetical protein